jgi:hypothetical protein
LEQLAEAAAALLVVLTGFLMVKNGIPAICLGTGGLQIEAPLLSAGVER